MARLVLTELLARRAPVAAVALAAAAALAVVASAATGAGCGAGEPRFCSVACGADGACPDGTSCGPDLYCHAPDEQTGSCVQASDPDGGDGEVNGDGGNVGSVDAGDGGAGSCDPCDLVEQCGCDRGSGCYTGSAGPTCAPAGALGEEGLCAAETDCSAGFGCAVEGLLPGHCQKYCSEDADCGGGLRLCNRAVPGSETRFCTSDCEPLDTTACAANEKCALDLGEDSRYDTRCLQDRGGDLLDVCIEQTDCGPGLICIEADVDGECQALCTIGGAPCDFDQSCIGFATPVVFGGVEYGVCLL